MAKEGLNLLTVIRDSGVKVPESGRFPVMIKCPFPEHKDDTPSFAIYADHWHCFGRCQTGGDAITYIQKQEGLSRGQAAQFLAEKYNLDAGEVRRYKSFSVYFAANDFAAKFFKQFLEQDKIAMKYLRDRGFTEETIKKFRLGYAPKDGEKVISLLRREGFSDGTLANVSLLNMQEHVPVPYFRDRIMFPLFDAQGRITGFAGRSLEEAPKNAKYLNGRTTEIFEKSRLLYGLNFAKSAIRETGVVVVGEGQTDTISAHQAGITNFVSISGASLTSEQANMLANFARTAVIATDADEAGIKAALGSYESLKRRQFAVGIAVIPEGFKDVDQVIREGKLEALVSSISHPHDFAEFSLNLTFGKYDANTRSGVVSIMRDFAPVIRATADYTDRLLLVREVCKRTGLVESEVLEALKQEKETERKADFGANGLFDERLVLAAIVSGNLKPGDYDSSVLQNPQHLRVLASFDAGELFPGDNDDARLLTYLRTQKLSKHERGGVADAIHRLEERRNHRKVQRLEETIIDADCAGDSKKLLAALKEYR